LTYLASPSYRHRLQAHAAQAGLTTAQARAAVAAAGRMVADLPLLWLRPAGQALGPLVQWQGAERLDQALAHGAGVLMLSPHIGAFEAVAQSYAERFGAAHPMTALFRPARKALLRALMAQSRDRPGLQTVPAQLAGVRQMIRALRRGDVVGLLPDQVPPDGQGVWVPFFGRPAYTMTLAGRLLQQTGAAALLVWCERLPRGQGFLVHVEDLPQALPDGDDPVQWATCINQAMEHVIRQRPEQYLWGYHRYKQPRTVPLASEP
jgi:KDO2-lipid IV(A) lauroyltransferase